MRLLTLLVCILLRSVAGSCQVVMPGADSSSSADDTMREVDPSVFLHELQGASLYEGGRFSAAESYLRKAFAGNPSEDLAGNLYYAMLFQGEDLEAADFRRKNSRFTYALPQPVKGLESIYAEGGPRISAIPGNAGNIGYTSIGAFLRLSATTRLWQSLSHLWQNRNMGSYSQFESHTALQAYVGRGWTLSPAFHYIYQPYTTVFSNQGPVYYEANYPDAGGGPDVRYTTNAIQTLQYTIPGRAHYLSLSVAASKRIGGLTIGAEPAFQYLPFSNTLRYSYSSAGVTDSFFNDNYRGSQPFNETGSGSRDTSAIGYTAQVGGFLAWRLPFLKERVTLRAAGYYLFDKEGSSATAIVLYGLVQASRKYWLHLSFLTKGKLPLLLSREGYSLNYTNPVRWRGGVSLQLFPLQRLSPALSYQYEVQTRLLDNTSLAYHSIYLSLKYKL